MAAKTKHDMDYQLIDTNQGLIDYTNQLKENNIRIVAMDLEAEYNLHSYGEKLALIQVYDRKNKILLDPLKINRRTLRLFLENYRVQKIMYDASSDMFLLQNSCDIKLEAVLDLRPAADLLDYEKRDLHSLINLELGMSLTKKSKFQKYNWLRRPLEQGALDYALSDVLYLFELKDVILKKLYENKMLEEFMRVNSRIQSRDYHKNSDDKHKKVKGFRELSSTEANVFKQLFETREKFAEEFNMPPHNLLSKDQLFQLINDPALITDLKKPKRMDIQDFSRLKKAIIKVLKDRRKR
ncbi:MAG: hypothetical protein JXR70_05605 [Spirochaetales bacterium]|nr:hypothetical protein [Spirochaetales bacterium]